VIGSDFVAASQTGFSKTAVENVVRSALSSVFATDRSGVL